MINKSYETLVNDFKNIGIKAGDVLVVHSSLKSMGNVDGGAETVINALIDVLGKDGTLIFPTFSFTPCNETSFFSNKDTPSCVGLISETFRKMKGVYRTNHPSHSVGIMGKLTYELTENELLNDTPMGIYSPYRRLASVGAKILMLGCTLHSNSYMHALEEDAGVEYALRGYQEYTIVDENGKEFKRSIRRHNFVRPNGTVAQRYDRTLDVLDEGDYKIADIHGAKSVLIDSVALKEKALKKFKECPLYFVDDLNGIYKDGCKTKL